YSDTRTSALMQDSINILTHTDAWRDCARDGGVMEALKIIDANVRPPIEITFRADEIGQDAFGVNMQNAVLLAALRKRAAKSKQIELLNAKLESFEADDFGVTAKLAGKELRAKLIVGADGRKSTVRACAGIEAKERDYGQHAITCLISHTRSHNNTSTEFHRPSGPFTLVPLPGKTSSVVWVDFNEPADSAMRMDKRSFTRALQDRSDGVLGEITLLTGPQSWQLQSLKAERLTARRAALIAEAAHVLHPLGAQGLNLSLRDAASLANVIIEAVRLGQDPGAAAILAQYERSRRVDIAGRVTGTDILNRFVSSNSPLFHRLRRAGIKSLENFTLLRELAMRHGMAA
ncbi:MAG TPA: FAD-dependent monooxygenase, partial [Patescibacteria group bacterium]|nr:FAD-dependent monooxygenase [Patescibacteria group bacterium]